MKFSRLPKAILFDMDGTLVDSIPFHQEAWLRFLESHGIHLGPDEFHAQNHGTIDEMIRRFFPAVQDSTALYALGQEKERTYREIYKPHIHEVAGLTPFLERIHTLGIQAHLATMGDRPNIDFVLDGLGIRSFFSSITGAEEVSKGKPNPEVFLRSIEKAKVHASDCWVLEDSKGGILAGAAAGCLVIGITTSHSPEELISYGAERTVVDFLELMEEFC
ncbi:HAD family hydrolase [Mariniradius sediminis]|uniref:HAD family phosphatase n=1 Tax=Mariniradius sediminis TaxID=2909237 RepID=A0ABS9BQN7_9BACT|nr:HAD family phosphatase [Mariniradius sediminis]MCF1750369.1 HAD family phosphatase [Mariniradius sediminis]